MKDDYFDRDEVSNSDLGWLKMQLEPSRVFVDFREAFRFGNLIDAMLTENDRLDFYKRKLDNVKYTKTDFEKAEKMKHSYLSDEYCMTLLKQSEGQKIFTKRLELDFNSYKFAINARCKFDLFIPQHNFGGDIKSTVAKTQKEFESSVHYFHYDRQRAFYLDLAGSDIDVLIGISKHNFKVFKVFIDRDSDLYRSGLEKYKYLAMKWHHLFGENKSVNTY